MTNHHELATEAAKAAPALTVGGLILFGVGLADWVLLTTLFYTLLQIAFLLRDRWWKKRKDYHGSK